MKIKKLSKYEFEILKDGLVVCKCEKIGETINGLMENKKKFKVFNQKDALKYAELCMK